MAQKDFRKNALLPGGLALAMSVGWIWPRPGLALATSGLGPLSWPDLVILAVFCLSGWQASIQELIGPGKLKRTLSAAFVLNLLLAPLIYFVLPMGGDAGLKLGLAIMLSVPTTLFSGVVVAENAKGNRTLAVALTLSLTLAGIPLLPYTLKFLLGSGPGSDFSATQLLLKILALSFLPLLAGAAFKFWSKKEYPKWLWSAPTLCVLLSVWMSVSKSASALSQAPLWTMAKALGWGAVVHTLLLIAAWNVAGWMKLKFPEKAAFLFVVSQKTVVLAVAVLILLPDSLTAGRLAGTTAACVAFHYAQILMDSILSTRLRTRKKLL